MTGAAAMHQMDAMEGHVLPVTFSWHLGFQTRAYGHRFVSEPGGRQRSIALLRSNWRGAGGQYDVGHAPPSDTNKWGRTARVGAASDPMPKAYRPSARGGVFSPKERTRCRPVSACRRFTRNRSGVA
jgi:hypothetical protein